MHKVFLFAVPAVILGLIACNKTSQEKANETAANVKQETNEAVQDIKESAQEATAKVKEESREAVADIKEGADQAVKNIKEEAGEVGDKVRGTGGSADRADNTSDARRAEGGTTVEAEARQTGRDVSEALGLDQARTKEDGKLNERIRAALNANAITRKDDDDVHVETDNGNVVIKGTVTTLKVKNEIAAVVKKVSGIGNVTDKVNVADRVGAKSNE